MASLAALIPYLAAIIFFFGQLLRLNFLGYNFPLLDPIIIVLTVINVTYLTFTRSLKIANKYFLAFTVWSLISLLINFALSEFSASALLYFLRLAALFSFFIFTPNYKLFSAKFFRFFLLLIFTNIIFGFIQYIYWPDFTSFKSLGWDPHLYRLVSTFFDPTFTALIYLFFVTIIFLGKTKLTSLKIFLVALGYVAMVLTYSRSTYLSLLTVAFFISIRLKNYRIVLFSLIIIGLTIILLPRQPGEGTKLERTSSIFAKIENYQQGFSLFKKSPLIGTGYNRLPQVRTDLKSDSNAISGYDGSLLTILVTTGLPGLLLFLLALITLFQSQTLTFQALLVGLLTHSLFANSLLYPWTLILLAFYYNSKYRI